MAAAQACRLLAASVWACRGLQVGRSCAEEGLEPGRTPVVPVEPSRKHRSAEGPEPTGGPAALALAQGAPGGRAGGLSVAAPVERPVVVLGPVSLADLRQLPHPSRPRVMPPPPDGPLAANCADDGCAPPRPHMARSPTRAHAHTSHAHSSL